MKSVISIRGHEDSLILLGNMFFNNTASKGVVYLDIKEEGWTNSVILVKDNTFEANGGYFHTVGLFIRAYTSVEIW